MAGNSSRPIKPNANFLRARCGHDGISEGINKSAMSYVYSITKIIAYSLRSREGLQKEQGMWRHHFGILTPGSIDSHLQHSDKTSQLPCSETKFLSRNVVRSNTSFALLHNQSTCNTKQKMNWVGDAREDFLEDDDNKDHVIFNIGMLQIKAITSHSLQNQTFSCLL